MSMAALMKFLINLHSNGHNSYVVNLLSVYNARELRSWVDLTFYALDYDNICNRGGKLFVKASLRAWMFMFGDHLLLFGALVIVGLFDTLTKSLHFYFSPKNNFEMSDKLKNKFCLNSLLQARFLRSSVDIICPCLSLLASYYIAQL